VNRWVEERVEAIRMALRIREFPAEVDLYRLVEWLDGCVILRHGAVSTGRCVHREDHRGVITLPLGVAGAALDQILAEELGHYLLTRGMGALLRQMGPEDRRSLRSARRWEWRDEALAREFLHAWYLPSAQVQRIPDDDELAFQGRCSPTMVRWRRESLGRQVVRLEQPPQWSASQQYRLTGQSGASCYLLQVCRRGRSEPEFLLPVRAGQAQTSATQLSADLIALTGREFEIKYGSVRYAPGEPVEITLPELRAWAGQEDE
jgi:hypothetical protein